MNVSIDNPAAVSDEAMKRGGIMSAPEATVEGGDVHSADITVNYDDYEELNVPPPKDMLEYDHSYTERSRNLYGERAQRIYGCNSEFNDEEKFIDRMTDALNIILLATSSWKGSTDAGLGLIIDLVIKFRVDYPDWKAQPESELFRLITGYPNGSDQLVQQWFIKEFGKKGENLLEMAKRFRIEQRPRLAQLNQTRTERKIEIRASESLRQMFKKTIAGCEDDFFPLRPLTREESVHASKTKTDNEESKLPFKKLVKILQGWVKENPNICSNCFTGEHEYAVCPKLRYDTRDNLAAYLDKGFSWKTHKKHYPHLHRMIDVANRRYNKNRP